MALKQLVLSAPNERLEGVKKYRILRKHTKDPGDLFVEEQDTLRNAAGRICRMKK